MTTQVIVRIGNAYLTYVQGIWNLANFGTTRFARERHHDLSNIISQLKLRRFKLAKVEQKSQAKMPEKPHND